MIDIKKRFEMQIREMIEACHRLGELGYVTSLGGNISYRVEDNVILITPTKTPKRTMQFEDICAVDSDGNTIYAPEGKKPTGETPLHTRIMKRRPDVSAVVHAHPPVLTGYAIAGNDILSKPFLPEPVLEVGPLLLVPYAEPVSNELADMFEPYIDNSNAFLMVNHGALICGKSVFEAVEQLQMMECMAYSVLVSLLLGNAQPLSEAAMKGIDNVIAAHSLQPAGGTGKFQSVGQLFKR